MTPDLSFAAQDSEPLLLILIRSLSDRKHLTRWPEYKFPGSELADGKGKVRYSWQWEAATPRQFYM